MELLQRLEVAVINNKRILKCLLMMIVSLLLLLNFSIGVSASSAYDRQEADACITISQRLSVKTSYGKSSSISGADNIADAARLKEYYKQAEKYGTGSIKELENGRFRFYEEIKPARTNGEMAGARHVREWDPYSGVKRDWYETIDHNGNIRQVRPDPNITGGVKVHYMFDSEGKYIGKWSPE